ncbi:hypothetical protein NEF87_001378 [Candidatus Lokiarchaeum ossiferum]|uniref:Tetratricopeptide repeat protein n=1 Tax=Candidatus Lokiarchaeum ossiferum TaxID=2951803 RepID=A0ABY6HP45_9ARCH|nr:hypothetical protein NEF87_001378 [Candidatus Lokiarchaeum sp. B-35]
MSKSSTSGLTSTERQFNHLIQDGISSYKRAIEAKTVKNTVKLAQSCIDKLEKAVQLTKIIGNEERNPYIYEYITLSSALIGNTYITNKDLLNAIEQFQSALENNKKTLGNEETNIRELYFLSKLMNIAELQENWRIADKYAIRMYPIAKKLEDSEKAMDYFTEIKDVFIKSKNLDMINNSYTQLLKICKKSKGFEKLKLSIAEIYSDYANYLEVVLNKKKKAKSYFRQAKDLFSEISLSEKAQEMSTRIEKLQ